jgi:hypothetical protein
LIRGLCAELRKNPAFAWFLTTFAERRDGELTTVLNLANGRKARDQATYRHNLLQEVCSFVDDQDELAIQVLEAK